VSILHPARTLIEKLLRVNNFAAVPEADEGADGWPRIGGQLYDIWALLGAEEVLGLLANPTASAATLASCFEVSQTFTPDQPVRGWIRTLVDLRSRGALAPRLRVEHQAALCHLYCGADPAPTFDDVLVRVRERAQLLDIGPA
jgi:hypothetical protein